MQEHLLSNSLTSSVVFGDAFDPKIERTSVSKKKKVPASAEAMEGPVSDKSTPSDLRRY